jgi:putative phosphoribosyl transferase
MQVIFADRSDAGRQLAQRLVDYRWQDCLVLGIPRGGVPVGYEISRALNCALDVIVPRKLPIPWSPQAGFGAIMPDGTRVLNEEMVSSLGLSPEQVDRIANQVLVEVRRREARYRGEWPAPVVTGKTVILTDDGLATGYTMLAAIRGLRRHQPREIIVAVPVSPRSTAQAVRQEADKFVVVHVSEAIPFAVAMFYHDFSDMSDEAVRALLERAAEEHRAEQREAA